MLSMGIQSNVNKSVHKKQHHTSKRIFERLRDEHGFTGGITIVKDYVAGSFILALRTAQRLETDGLGDDAADASGRRVFVRRLGWRHD